MEENLNSNHNKYNNKINIESKATSDIQDIIKNFLSLRFKSLNKILRIKLSKNNSNNGNNDTIKENSNNDLFSNETNKYRLQNKVSNILLHNIDKDNDYKYLNNIDRVNKNSTTIKFNLAFIDICIDFIEFSSLKFDKSEKGNSGLNLIYNSSSVRLFSISNYSINFNSKCYYCESEIFINEKTVIHSILEQCLIKNNRYFNNRALINDIKYVVDFDTKTNSHVFKGAILELTSNTELLLNDNSSISNSINKNNIISRSIKDYNSEELLKTFASCLNYIVDYFNINNKSCYNLRDLDYNSCLVNFNINSNSSNILGNSLIYSIDFINKKFDIEENIETPSNIPSNNNEYRDKKKSITNSNREIRLVKQLHNKLIILTYLIYKSFYSIFQLNKKQYSSINYEEEIMSVLVKRFQNTTIINKIFSKLTNILNYKTIIKINNKTNSNNRNNAINNILSNYYAIRDKSKVPNNITNTNEIDVNFSIDEFNASYFYGTCCYFTNDSEVIEYYNIRYNHIKEFIDELVVISNLSLFNMKIKEYNYSLSDCNINNEAEFYIKNDIYNRNDKLYKYSIHDYNGEGSIKVNENRKKNRNSSSKRNCKNKDDGEIYEKLISENNYDVFDISASSIKEDGLDNSINIHTNDINDINNKESQDIKYSHSKHTVENRKKANNTNIVTNTINTINQEQEITSTYGINKINHIRNRNIIYNGDKNNQNGIKTLKHLNERNEDWAYSEKKVNDLNIKTSNDSKANNNIYNDYDGLNRSINNDNSNTNKNTKIGIKYCKLINNKINEQIPDLSNLTSDSKSNNKNTISNNITRNNSPIPITKSQYYNNRLNAIEVVNNTDDSNNNNTVTHIKNNAEALSLSITEDLKLDNDFNYAHIINDNDAMNINKSRLTSINLQPKIAYKIRDYNNKDNNVQANINISKYKDKENNDDKSVSDNLSNFVLIKKPILKNENLSINKYKVLSYDKDVKSNNKISCNENLTVSYMDNYRQQDMIRRILKTKTISSSNSSPNTLSNFINRNNDNNNKNNINNNITIKNYSNISNISKYRECPISEIISIADKLIKEENNEIKALEIFNEYYEASIRNSLLIYNNNKNNSNNNYNNNGIAENDINYLEIAYFLYLKANLELKLENNQEAYNNYSVSLILYKEESRKAEKNNMCDNNIINSNNNTLSQVAIKLLLIISSIYHNIAIIYNRNHNLSLAIKHFHKSLSIKQNLLKPNSQSTASTCYSLANIYLESNDNYKALKYFQKTLSMYLVINENMIDIATVYNALGLVYNKLYSNKDINDTYVNDKNEYKDLALKMFFNSLEYCKRLFENKKNKNIMNAYYDEEEINVNISSLSDLKKCSFLHPLCGSVFNNIGLVYFKSGLSDKSIEFFNIAIYIRKQLKLNKINDGNLNNEINDYNESKELASCYNNLAGAYFKLKKYYEAEENYKNSLKLLGYLNDIRDRCNDKNDNTNNKYYNSYDISIERSDKYEYLSIILKESLTTDRNRIYSNNNTNKLIIKDILSEITSTLNNLALVYVKINYFKNAVKLFSRSLNIKTQMLNKNMISDIEIAIACSNLAGVLYELLKSMSKSQENLHGKKEHFAYIFKSSVSLYKETIEIYENRKNYNIKDENNIINLNLINYDKSIASSANSSGDFSFKDIIRAYLNIAHCYYTYSSFLINNTNSQSFDINFINDSIKYYCKALNICLEYDKNDININNNNTIATKELNSRDRTLCKIYRYIGNAYILSNNSIKAQEYYDNSDKYKSNNMIADDK